MECRGGLGGGGGGGGGERSGDYRGNEDRRARLVLLSGTRHRWLISFQMSFHTHTNTRTHAPTRARAHTHTHTHTHTHERTHTPVPHTTTYHWQLGVRVKEPTTAQEKSYSKTTVEISLTFGVGPGRPSPPKKDQTLPREHSQVRQL